MWMTDLSMISLSGSNSLNNVPFTHAVLDTETAPLLNGRITETAIRKTDTSYVFNKLNHKNILFTKYGILFTGRSQCFYQPKGLPNFTLPLKVAAGESLKGDPLALVATPPGRVYEPGLQYRDMIHHPLVNAHIGITCIYAPG